MSRDDYLEDALFMFGYFKDLGERAMAQLSDDEFRRKPDATANSVVIVVKHMAGKGQVGQLHARGTPLAPKQVRPLPGTHILAQT